MIIPMIDIIFFLLVFFMMSMLTMVVQRSIDLNLPQTATAKIVVKETLPVSITAGGDIYVEQEKEGFVFVLDQLKSAGINRVGIATESKLSGAE